MLTEALSRLSNWPLPHQTDPSSRWIWAIGTEMAGNQRKDLKVRLYCVRHIPRRALWWSRADAFFIGIRNKTEPQAVGVQVTADLFGKRLPLTGRIQRVEAAPVKGESEWRSVNLVIEDVQNGERTPSIRFGSFLFGLLYCNRGCINSDHGKVLLREPNCIIAGPASDFHGFTRSDGQGRYNVDEVDISHADIPRGGTFSVSFGETIFGCHVRLRRSHRTAAVRALNLIEWR
jgi:hypothetical protein